MVRVAWCGRVVIAMSTASDLDEHVCLVDDLVTEDLLDDVLERDDTAHLRGGVAGFAICGFAMCACYVRVRCARAREGDARAYAQERACKTCVHVRQKVRTS